MRQKESGVQRATQQILSEISKIYDNHQKSLLQSQQLSQQSSMFSSEQNTRTKEFTKLLPDIENHLVQLADAIDINKTAKQKDQLRDAANMLRNMAQDVGVLLREPLQFRVESWLLQLATATKGVVAGLRADLNFIGENKFLCCGTNGYGKFKIGWDKLKIQKIQWSILSKLKSNPSLLPSPKKAQNILAPQFNPRQYNFIRQILMREWPQITVKQTVRTVEKIIQKQKVQAVKKNMLHIANQYIYGINCEENPAYGLKIYHQEAALDNPIANIYLGQIYEEGVLVPRNRDKAKEYYSKAVNKNQPYAMYRYGIGIIKGAFHDGQINKTTFEQGVSMLLKSAQGSNPVPEALVEIGQLYEKGKFESDKNGYYTVDIDIRRAVDYYLKAREMNVPRASNNLGVLFINNRYMSDLNTTRRIIEDSFHDNCSKGLMYLEEAQNMGFAQAYYNVGYIQENGLLGTKNLQQALMSYYKGGVKGDLQSQLKFAYQLMNQTSIVKQQYEDHYKIAHRWLDAIASDIEIIDEKDKDRDRERSREQLYSETKISYTPAQKAEALYYLALMYEYGFGVDKSPKKAFTYFGQASDAGYVHAKNKIGDCYFSGFGVKEDKKIALGCYLEAAKAKNSDAMVNLGTIYLNGVPGVADRNYNQAYKHLSEAAALQNSNAMIHLSYMYSNGLGLKSDRQMAKKWLQESASNKNATALYMLRGMGVHLDHELLFQNIDHEMMSSPRKINLRERVPYLSNIRT